MTDEELDGYLILILFMLKRKNPCPQKNLKDFIKGNIQIFFAGLAIKTRIAFHPFSKEFILSQGYRSSFFLKLFKALIF